MNQFKIKYITGRRKQAGATLLIIIIGMIVVVVLGVALYTLTSTATLNQAVAQRAARAFYLSESGTRIAAGEHRAAVIANNVNTKLPTLHAKEFNMPGNGGKVQIEVYPYWFYATTSDAASSNSTTLYMHLPGALPLADDTDAAIPITFPSSGLLKVRDAYRTPQWNGITAAPYTSVAVGGFDSTYGTPVTFNFGGTGFTDTIVKGDEFYIGYYNQYDSTLTGNDLILKVTDINTAKLFPPSKGVIFIVKTDIKFYKYDLRIIDSGVAPIAVKLTNIQDIQGSTNKPSVILNNSIYVGRTLGFRSKSTYGN
jgi:hypothetical protein